MSSIASLGGPQTTAIPQAPQTPAAPQVTVTPAAPQFTMTPAATQDTMSVVAEWQKLLANKTDENAARFALADLKFQIEEGVVGNDNLASVVKQDLRSAGLTDDAIAKAFSASWREMFNA